MERAAKQLKEEAKRERSESAASALGEQAQTVWAKLNANGPVTAEVFVQVHGIASSAGSLSVFTRLAQRDIVVRVSVRICCRLSLLVSSTHICTGSGTARL